MKRLIILIIVVVLNGNISIALAGADEKELGISYDATWVSKYIWRGQDFYDDHASFQPSVNFDLYGTGFSVQVWGSYAGSSGFRDTEEYDYIVRYGSTLFEDQTFQTDYSILWAYYDVYDAPTRDNDTQEVALDLSWPGLFGGKIVPAYQFAYYYAAHGGGAIAADKIEGFTHLFGFSYDLPALEIIENPLTFSWDITYNDGQGASVDHDWSHMTWCLSTSFEDTCNGTLTPALYYQTSMDDSVNTEDEFWVGISYGFEF